MALKRPLRRPQWNVRIEAGLQAEIKRQAEKVGLAFATYVEYLLAQAHCYDGQYLPEVTAPEETAQPMGRIREKVAALTADDCVQVGKDNAMKPIKLEEPLHDLIEERCRRELGVAYSAYIRAVLREAAGHTLPGHGEQSALDDLTLPRRRRGGVQLQKVG